MLRERRDDPGDTRTIDQITADAVVELILNGNQHRRPGSTELVVLIDYATLLDGLHDASVHETWDGTRLTPDTIRRIACDTHVIPIVMGGPSELLDAGRQQRTANRAQRRALRAIYRGCAIDGCTVPFHRCEIHHIIPWWRHGMSDFANLLPLCTPASSPRPRQPLATPPQPPQPATHHPPPQRTHHHPTPTPRTHPTTTHHHQPTRPATARQHRPQPATATERDTALTHRTTTATAPRPVTPTPANDEHPRPPTGDTPAHQRARPPSTAA